MPDYDFKSKEFTPLPLEALQGATVMGVKTIVENVDRADLNMPSFESKSNNPSLPNTPIAPSRNNGISSGK